MNNILKKQGYNLYFYRDERGYIEINFLVRDANSLVPIEVKAQDSATKSLNKMINNQISFGDIDSKQLEVLMIFGYAYADLVNNTRMWENCGYTPTQIRTMDGNIKVRK